MTTDPHASRRRRPRLLRAALLALLALGGAGPARADGVPPPPSSCPGGATPTSGHCGQQCLPMHCTADADCGAGKSCRELPLCIKTLTCRGNISIDGGVFTSETVIATCGNGRDCASDAPCKTVRVCAGPDVIVTGCAASGRPGPASAFALLLGVLAAATLLSRRSR